MFLFTWVFLFQNVSYFLDSLRITAYLKCSQYSWTAWPSNMGLIGCPEMSVTDCQSALRKMPVERRSPFQAMEG